MATACLCLFADFTRGRARSVRSFGKPGGKTDDHRPVKDQRDHGAFATKTGSQGGARSVGAASHWELRRSQETTRDERVPLGEFVDRARMLYLVS